MVKTTNAETTIVKTYAHPYSEQFQYETEENENEGK